jgi:hypothetical protein
MQTTETRWLARQCCRGVQGKSRRFVSEEGRVDVVAGTQIKHTIAALVGSSSKYLPCLQTKHVALVSASSKYLLYRMQKKNLPYPVIDVMNCPCALSRSLPPVARCPPPMCRLQTKPGRCAGSLQSVRGISRRGRANGASEQMLDSMVFGRCRALLAGTARTPPPTTICTLIGRSFSRARARHTFAYDHLHAAG